MRPIASSRVKPDTRVKASLTSSSRPVFSDVMVSDNGLASKAFEKRSSLSRSAASMRVRWVMSRVDSST